MNKVIFSIAISLICLLSSCTSYELYVPLALTEDGIVEQPDLMDDAHVARMIEVLTTLDDFVDWKLEQGVIYISTNTNPRFLAGLTHKADFPLEVGDYLFTNKIKSSTSPYLTTDSLPK